MAALTRTWRSRGTTKQGETTFLPSTFLCSFENVPLGRGKAGWQGNLTIGPDFFLVNVAQKSLKKPAFQGQKCWCRIVGIKIEERHFSTSEVVDRTLFVHIL